MSGFVSQRPKIITLDQDERIQAILADELADLGYEVTTCPHPCRLPGLIEEIEPDAVIMGDWLGEYKGLSLLQEIRKAYYNLPIILWTAYFTYKFDPRSLAADYYVIKKFNIKELKQKIDMALEGACFYPEKFMPEFVPMPA